MPYAISRNEYGPFTVDSGSIVVSDPCYGFDEENCFEAESGEWYAEASLSDEGDWGYRVSALDVYLDGHEYDGLNTVGVCVPVDSGQLGVYDGEFFRENASNDAFYNEACNLTLSDGQCGVSDFFAVSRTGFGDGMYGVTMSVDALGKITRIFVTFIDDERDEDYEDYE